MTSTTFFYMPRSQEQYKLESIKGHITDRWLATVPNGLIKENQHNITMKQEKSKGNSQVASLLKGIYMI